jgi:muramoyltetrapeptide carboxypeptidase
LVGCTDPKRARPTALAVVREILGARGKPLVTGLRFGHVSPNLPWPVGIRGRLDGGKGELAVLEPAVE